MAKRLLRETPSFLAAISARTNNSASIEIEVLIVVIFYTKGEEGVRRFRVVGFVAAAVSGDVSFS